jgi:hypothetical protein
MLFLVGRFSLITSAFHISSLHSNFLKVILAGNKETVTRALEKAERFRTELLRRGVLLIPVIWGSEKKEPVQKKGFGVPRNASVYLPSVGVRWLDSYWSWALLAFNLYSK